MLGKEASPDPMLAVEEADQGESERRVVVGCMDPLWQETGWLLAEGGLEKAEVGSEKGQQRGRFAVAEQ